MTPTAASTAATAGTRNTQRTLLVVSGASRGLGRAIAVAVAVAKWFPHYHPTPKDSFLDAILLARSVEGLHDTQQAMQTRFGQAETKQRPGHSQEQRNHSRTYPLTIYTYPVDLGNLSTLQQELDPIFQRHCGQTKTSGVQMNHHHNNQNHHKAILINCAGTTGPIGPSPTATADMNELRRAIDLNVTSKVWLTSQFLKWNDDHRTTRDGDTTTTTNGEPTVVVNISSMCAVKPTPTMATYCATSAARDMYHAVVAQEFPHARILNYAPGSCDTDMQAGLRHHPSLDPSVQAYCQGLLQVRDDNNVVNNGKEKEKNNITELVRCEDTAEALVRHLFDPSYANHWESESRIEYVSQDTYQY